MGARTGRRAIHGPGALAHPTAGIFARRPSDPTDLMVPRERRRCGDLVPFAAMAQTATDRDRQAFRRRVVRDGLILFGLLAVVNFYVVFSGRDWRGPSTDGLVYWGVNPGDPYHGATVGGTNAYRYSPAFAQLFSLVGRLPRDVFIVGWTLFIGSVAIWLARPWPAALLVLLLPVSQDLIVGNIHVLTAGAIVLGFRWPGLWAFVLLTKVSPGIGLVWFAARREWRSLLIAVGVTSLIVAVSFALAPGPWGEWIDLLRRDGRNEATRLIPRVMVAVGICAWGALTNRRWTVPLAATIALPVIWSDAFAMLLGCVALGRERSPAATQLAQTDGPVVAQAEAGLPDRP